MKKVTGIGGVFFKSENPEATKAWYAKHLGIDAGKYGHMFEWAAGGSTTWSIFTAGSDYFGGGDQPFMINYRVADLEALLAELRAEGVAIVGDMQVFDYGKFAWINDCDGRRVELWEPIDQPLIDFEAAQS